MPSRAHRPAVHLLNKKKGDLILVDSTDLQQLVKHAKTMPPTLVINNLDQLINNLRA